MGYPLRGYVADFTMVTDEARERYLKCIYDIDQRIDALDSHPYVTRWLHEARDCYILGLYDLAEFLCGKILEEMLALNYYEQTATRYCEKEAAKKVENKRLGELIEWGQEMGYIPTLSDPDERKRKQALIIYAVKYVRDLNAHANLIMVQKIKKKLDLGNDEARALGEIIPKQHQYHDWQIELAEAIGVNLDSKKPSVDKIFTEEAAFTILKAIIEIIEQLAAKGPPI
jgi:hypothetical protein